MDKTNKKELNATNGVYMNIFNNEVDVHIIFAEHLTKEEIDLAFVYESIVKEICSFYERFSRPDEKDMFFLRLDECLNRKMNDLPYEGYILVRRVV